VVGGIDGGAEVRLSQRLPRAAFIARHHCGGRAELARGITAADARSWRLARSWRGRGGGGYPAGGSRGAGGLRVPGKEGHHWWCRAG
jgi:hypothetical protein